MGIAQARHLLMLMRRMVLYLTNEEMYAIAKILDGAVDRLEREAKGD